MGFTEGCQVAKADLGISAWRCIAASVSQTGSGGVWRSEAERKEMVEAGSEVVEDVGR
jgi:hypothetical protein